MKYRNTSACTTRHTNNICFLYLGGYLLPKPNFPLFGFLSIFSWKFRKCIKESFSQFSLFLLFITITLLISPMHFFISKQDQSLAFKIACIFKIFSAQSCLAVFQYFEKINKCYVHSSDFQRIYR